MVAAIEPRVIPITDVPAFLGERGFRTRYGRPPSLRTVQGWAERGEIEVLPARRGGVRHVSVDELERILEGGDGGGQGEGRRQGSSNEPARSGQRRSRRRQAQTDAEAQEYLKKHVLGGD